METRRQLWIPLTATVKEEKKTKKQWRRLLNPDLTRGKPFQQKKWEEAGT